MKDNHSESPPYLIFEKATSQEDKNAFIAQLIEAQLPYADIDEATELFLLREAKTSSVIGTAGLEWYGQNALLRSVSVSTFYRGKGVGKQILFEIEKIAHSRQAKGIYLLTETAKNFFEKNNYLATSRQSIPKEVLASPQFTSTCPSTATAMVKILF